MGVEGAGGHSTSLIVEHLQSTHAVGGDNNLMKSAKLRIMMVLRHSYITTLEHVLTMQKVDSVS